MGSYNPNNIIAEIRQRKRASQEALLDDCSYINRESVSRIENNRQAPNKKTVSTLISNLDLPTKGFVYPHFENQTPLMLQLKDELLYNLLRATDLAVTGKKAEDLIQQLENTGNFIEGVNRQFILSCTAILREIQGKDPSKTMTIIIEAMAITYPEFNNETFEGDVLIFEEMNLLHTKAQTYKRGGDLQTAIKLLEHILEGMNRLPKDDRDKEQKHAPILLTLAECYMQDGNYKKALETCKVGYDVILKRNKGFYLPDFAQCIADCYNYLGEKEEVAQWAKRAYFGYVQLRRNAKAAKFWQYANDELGVCINTYGVDKLQLELPEPTFVHGNPATYSEIGQMIAAFRDEAKVTMDNLVEGICSNRGRLSKIEDGTIQGNVYELEAIMQRLGRDIDKYFNTFLSIKEFLLKQKRDEMNALLANRKFDQAEKLLFELEGEKSYQKFVNKQFLELSKVQIKNARKGYTPEEHFAKLQDVMRMTRKNFDMRDVAKTRLTYYEIKAVNMMAGNLYSSGKTSDGLRLFEDLIQSMDTYYVDGVAKMRMYPTVLYNYSRCLGLSNRHDEVLPIVEKGKNLCILYNQFKTLPGLAMNKAGYLLAKGEKEKSLAYAALAHYGSALIGRHKNVENTAKWVSENFGIGFD